MRRSTAWLSVFRNFSEWTLALEDINIMCIADPDRQDSMKILRGDEAVYVRVREEQGRVSIVIESEYPTSEEMSDLCRNVAYEAADYRLRDSLGIVEYPFLPTQPRLAS